MEKCLSRRCKSPVHEDNLCKFHFAERDFLVTIGKRIHEMTDEDLKAFSEVSGYSMDEIFKLNFKFYHMINFYNSIRKKFHNF